MIIIPFIGVFFSLQAVSALDFPMTWQELSSLCYQVLLLDCNKGYIADGDERLCSTDGVTYQNFCLYAQGRCRKPDITLAYFGECLNSTNSDISGGPMSSTPPPHTTTQDIIVQVFCAQATLDSCPLELDPVCGTDGNFYRNECFFAIAKCTQNSLQTQVLENCSTDQLSVDKSSPSPSISSIIGRKK
ncbi:ovomucoid-like [Ostrea edulis]|uniref:ovomucoid-like n=1 Tax=Ostrea edulis TaxID=37623 RepID=UPI0020952A3B|nr:ovomucoid-like [Ostrea edulis]